MVIPKIGLLAKNANPKSSVNPVDKVFKLTDFSTNHKFFNFCLLGHTENKILAKNLLPN